jgi:glycosyltransferase involved in cell wall biosynthesis
VRVFWYFPWPAHRWLGVAHGVAARNHRVVMQCFRATPDEPVPVPPPGLALLAELPRPVERRERTPAWAADRSRLLAGRVGRRSWRLRTVGTDVCHVHLLHHLTDPAVLGSVARRQTLVSTVHDLTPHQSRLPARLEHGALRRLYATAGHLVVHHAALAEGLTERFGVEPARITVMAHPVFPSPLPPRPATGTSTLIFGALRRNKGVPVLLRAMAARPDDDVQLTIAGRGAPEIERMVREAASLDSRITAEIGYVSDARKAELYRAAGLIVLPYTAFESQSGVLHDAYAHARPVVVTDVGALGATVRADKTGWVVPPCDAEALATTILAALGDGRARAAAAEAAVRVAGERSPEAVGGAMAKLYERLTGLGPSQEHGAVVERAANVAPPVR